MYVQLSIIIIDIFAISGDEKKAGDSHPKAFANFVIGPNLTSNIDLPTIQLTATGLNIKGSKKETLKNFLPAIFAFKSNAKPKAIANSTITKIIYISMLYNAFQ